MYEEQTVMFPAWTSSFQILYTLNFSSQYSFSENNSILTVSDFSTHDKAYQIKSKLSIVEKLDDLSNSVKMIMKRLEGCEQSYFCLTIHKRTESIIELEEGLSTPALLAACADTNFGPENKFTLLVKDGLDSSPCPVIGIHHVVSLSLDNQTDKCGSKAFTRLKIGCSTTDNIQFLRECPGKFCQS